MLLAGEFSAVLACLPVRSLVLLAQVFWNVLKQTS